MEVQVLLFIALLVSYYFVKFIINHHQIIKKRIIPENTKKIILEKTYIKYQYPFTQNINKQKYKPKKPK